MKKLPRYCVVILSSITLISLYAEGPDRQPTVVDKRDPDDENSQLFIGSPDGKDEALLCKYTRSVGVVFSKDSSWLAVNEHTASSGGDEIRLFRWVQGLQYTEQLYETKLSEVFLEEARKTFQFGDYPDDFGCNCVGWTEGARPKCLIEILVTLDEKDHMTTYEFDPDTGQYELHSGN